MLPHFSTYLPLSLDADLLTDDFTTSISLKCKKSAGPVAVTIETTRCAKGALSSKVGSKFAYSGLSFDKVQATASGGHVLETSYKAAPGVVLSFKGNKGADLGVDYTNGSLFATGVLDVKDMSKLSASACLGMSSGAKIGGDATYALSGKTGITSFNLGASYATGPVFASVTTSSKFAEFNLGLLYKVNNDLTLASKTTHSSSKVCDCVGVGAAYKAPVGLVKAKFASGGVLSASFIKDVAPSVTLTLSGSIVASDMSDFKYGVGLSM
jgi:voltage-dependent anion channel protein 2